MDPLPGFSLSFPESQASLEQKGVGGVSFALSSATFCCLLKPATVAAGVMLSPQPDLSWLSPS